MTIETISVTIETVSVTIETTSVTRETMSVTRDTMIRTTEMHSAGEPLRIIESGYPRFFLYNTRPGLSKSKI